MEVRGLGLINIRDLFGVASTRTSKRVEFVVSSSAGITARELRSARPRRSLHHELLGLQVPKVTMPVAPGRNLAILVEVAARNQLLRARGIHAARELRSTRSTSARTRRRRGLDDADDADDLDDGGAA